LRISRGNWPAKLRAGVAALGPYWPPGRRHVVLAAVVVATLGWLGWRTCGFTGCPSVARLAAYQPGGAPVLLDHAGNEVAQLAPVSRELVDLAALPEHVGAAFVAVEDRRFLAHGGVDWRRTAGSLLANLRARGVREGGSTITMQLARNVFPDRLPGQERSVRRKVLEVRVAREIERTFTKDEILELYLNHIYFGGAVYGIEGAARHYFGKSAAALDLAEAATLAAMPKAPNTYDPRSHPQRARERRDRVLGLMAAQGRIEVEAADRTRALPIRVVPERPVSRDSPPPAPYFVQAARRALEAQLGDALYSHPLRIHTTLDMDVQRAAERALENRLRAIERGVYGRFASAGRYGAADAVTATGTRYLQGAVVVLDAESGDILALVGGRDYQDSPFDRAMRGRRQVGSAFKPFVYAAALADGYAPSQRLTDEPLEMELTGGERWAPRNFDGRYSGEVTLRDAAVRSNNVATVRLALAVGMSDVVRTARRSGVENGLHELPSLALGTAELSLLELTSAYTPFATLGHRVRPRFIRLVEDSAGRTVWSSKVERRKVLDEGVAYLVTDLLRDAVDRGTGRAVRSAGFTGPAAGKTGTTDAGHDVWFVGYTPDLVAGVWIGFDRPQPVLADATGGTLAAPVWGDMMRTIRRGRPAPETWSRPPDVVERRVDPASGLVLADGCDPLTGESTPELFLRSDLPATVCPAGEPAEKGRLARLADGIRSFFGRAGGALAGLFRSDEDEAELRRQQAEQDRYLGRPRLPRARDRAEDGELPEPLGVPLDSIPGWGEVPVPADTVDEPPEPAPDPAAADPAAPPPGPVTEPPPDGPSPDGPSPEALPGDRSGPSADEAADPELDDVAAEDDDGGRRIGAWRADGIDHQPQLARRTQHVPTEREVLGRDTGDGPHPEPGAVAQCMDVHLHGAVVDDGDGGERLAVQALPGTTAPQQQGEGGDQNGEVDASHVALRVAAQLG
jgi:penicillin-binding protein 1A